MKPKIIIYRIGSLVWWKCSAEPGLGVIGDSPRNAYLRWEKIINANKR
jgi:hypothetical protein